MPKRDDINSVLVIGSGPIVIGQACEFDYSGTQACRVLREEGVRVILVNSNPATIMTDPDFADATYIEPITWQVIETIIAKERPDAILPTLGGQTALNAAIELHNHGILEKYDVELIGASFEAINKGEDRQIFKQLVLDAGADVARSIIAHTMDDLLEGAAELGYPLVVRPSFTMGGLGSGFAYDEEDLRRIGGRELLERESRHLDDDVVERGLEARRGDTRDVVGDLVETVAECELGRELGDRESGGLRGEGARARDARVHLDDDDAAVAGVDGELDVAATGVYADGADDVDADVAELLVLAVGERQSRGDRDRVARVHADRVDVLDRADDHRVVGGVAHELELVLLPAEDRLLQEHLGGRRIAQTGPADAAQVLFIVCEARAETCLLYTSPSPRD